MWTKKTDTNDKPRRNFIAPTLAIITTLGVLALFYTLTYTDCKAPKEVTFFILGAASSWVTTILTYYFGSSHGSDKKSDLMAQMAQPQIAPPSRTLEVVPPPEIPPVVVPPMVAVAPPVQANLTQ